MDLVAQVMLRNIGGHIISVLADTLDIDLVLLHRGGIRMEGKNSYNHKDIEDQGQDHMKEDDHGMRISKMR